MEKHLQDLMTELGWAPGAYSLASNENPEGYYVRPNPRGSESLLVPLDLLEDATNGDAGRESRLRRTLADRLPKPVGVEPSLSDTQPTTDGADGET